VRMGRSFGVLAVLLAAAPAPPAERSQAIRVHVQVAEGATGDLGESERDVRQVLYDAENASRLVQVPLGDADLLLVLNNRTTGLPPVHVRGTDVDATRLRYSLSAVVIDARRQPQPLVGRGVVWRQAATDLVRQLTAFVRDHEHVLLRRRSDWPRTGFEFEPLTKEHERSLGTKGGAVVVTEVAPESPAAQAGLQAGDVVLKLGTHKVESAGALARSLYGVSAGEVLALEVGRAGARRSLSVAIP
jgi:membrane-associated protease RseP (regulator of RpoE activity)